MKRILVAEDDPLTRQGLGDLLSAEGFEVYLAAHGDEAWTRFQSLTPDLVCLDLMMPRQSGYEVLKKIRAQNPAVPVLLISAKSEEIDKVIGLELGADDFIVKPFGTREVIARVRSALRRTELAKSGQEPGDAGVLAVENFRVGDIDVMPSELSARRGEGVVKLSAREVKILHLLHQKRGKIVDRMSFFRYAWDLEAMPESRTLDQHIAQLRKKIEIDPKNPVIVLTVQGIGYKTP